MRVIAVDPGKATGLAFRDTETAHQWWITLEDTTQIMDVVRRSEPDLVHVEEFRINAKTAAKPGDQWSTKLFGILQQYAKDEGLLFRSAPAVAAKGFVSNKVLKGIGKFGSEHEKDAVRHLILALAMYGDEWAKKVLREAL